MYAICITCFFCCNGTKNHKMKDKTGKIVNVGCKVAFLHKKKPTTTPTLQIGVIRKVFNSICIVESEGLNQTRHKSTSIVIING